MRREPPFSCSWSDIDFPTRLGHWLQLEGIGDDGQIRRRVTPDAHPATTLAPPELRTAARLTGLQPGGWLVLAVRKLDIRRRLPAVVDEKVLQSRTLAYRRRLTVRFPACIRNQRHLAVFMGVRRAFPIRHLHVR